MNKNGLHFSTHRLLFIALIILSGGIGLFTNTALPNLAIPVYASNPVADETDAVIYVASDDKSTGKSETRFAFFACAMSLCDNGIHSTNTTLYKHDHGHRPKKAHARSCDGFFAKLSQHQHVNDIHQLSAKHA